MQIRLNGLDIDLPDQCTVAQLLALQGLAGRRLAVEVNQAIVPRSQHDDHALAAGDRVEIVQALGGG